MTYIKFIVFLHILGGCVWVGGHLILLLRYLPQSLKTKDPSHILRFEEKYEKIGIPALIVQVITGVLLGFSYHINWFGFNSPADVVVNLKLILLLATVGLAVHARLFIIPKLNEKNLMRLAWHIAAVTLLAVCFVYLGVSFRMGF
ncbi:CopD family protein [Sinomicrobium kalidii]|uniref:CopD family protein n=1 Tax=Sinomicrobium kalidii TaxID=2900738 RepID=UPI001E478BF5|nr:CopD family protein [Sinomicrobium kalidii]UGU14641.1 CopD family protein [Sinomicrobium kalidii]